MFLVMTFIGQSIAAVNLSCSMTSSAANQMAVMLMGGMDHSAHAMHDLADHDQAANDCCEDDACPMNSCTGSPSMNVTAVAKDSSLYASLLNAEYSDSYLNPITLSLFRPPISR